MRLNQCTETITRKKELNDKTVTDNTLGKIWKALNAAIVEPQLLPQRREEKKKEKKNYSSLSYIA